VGGARPRLEGVATAVATGARAFCGRGPNFVTPVVTPRPMTATSGHNRSVQSKAGLLLGNDHIEIVRAAYGPSRKLLHFRVCD
jgi:hypothetical protein